MPPFNVKSRGTSTMQANRLETPLTVGYRIGMSSSGVIGRKLGIVYNVETDLPSEIDVAIHQLHSKLLPSR